MRKNIVSSTIIHLIIAAISKVLSFVVRIYLARVLSVQAMRYYSLVNPTMLFLITLSQLGLPSAFSKTIAQSKQRKPILKAGLLISFISNTFLIILCLLCFPFYARNILNDIELLPLLYAILPFLIFVSISGILKGYLLGREKHLIVGVAQIFEEIFRLAFLFLMFQKSYSPVLSACISMIGISVAEIGSIITMTFALNLTTLAKNIQQFHHTESNRNHILSLLSVGLPITAGRVLYTITGFIEPMLLTQSPILYREAVLNIYTQMNGYFMPVLTLSSFIGQTISSLSLPILSKAYIQQKKNSFQSLAHRILLFSFMIALISSLIIFFFSEELLQLFYHTSSHYELLRKLSIPFILLGIQSPLSTLMHATNQSKQSLIDSLCGCAVRFMILLFFMPVFQEYTFPIAMIGGICTTSLMHFIRLIPALFN